MTNRCISLAKLLGIAACSALTILVLAGCSDGSDQFKKTVPTPELNGPVVGNASLPGPFFEDRGYEKAEYFVSGDAQSYSNVNELTASGEWQIQEADTARFNTRIIVFRPSEQANFNGTVIVEWLNVSSGTDLANDWMVTHTELTRRGYAWVGVSAQSHGVDSLKSNNEDRYSSLEHPGDSFSYSMFSQIGQLIGNPGSSSPLGALRAETLLAAGESQSAHRLMTYVNTLGPVDSVYDGYFIHSRYFSSAPLSQAPQPVITSPEIVRVREDLKVPVMMFQTESDVVALDSYRSRQPDSPYFRLWETAGTAHADYYITITNRSDSGTDPQVAAVFEEELFCDKPINTGPQHFLAKAALAALNQWVVSGEEPSMAERLVISEPPVELVRDEFGIALGGIRTPFVDAPLATLSGEGNSSETFGFCNRLFGTTKLLDEQTLASRYTDRNAYISEVNASTDRAVSKGFLIAEDAALIKTYAAEFDLFPQ